jgi:outer membrane protein assembly factor BamB
LAFFLLLGLGLAAWMHYGTFMGGTARGPGRFYALVFTGLLSLVWLMFFSGLSWMIRLFGLAIVAALALSVRQKEFAGDMTPRFEWRWSPRAESRLTPLNVSPAGEEPPLPDAFLPTDRDYPQFLGPARDGKSANVRLEPDWEVSRPRVLWRKLIGPGWSAFSVVGRAAVTQEQRGTAEMVSCYDVQTGRIYWAHEDQARFSESMGGDGPRATPTIHNGRVYAIGATGVLNCLELQTGALVWSHDVLSDAEMTNIEWGKSSSPLVVNDVVVVTLGRKEGTELLLAAYRLDSGERAWVGGSGVASYASPVLTTLAGQQQIVSMNAQSVSGHDPADGKTLWEYTWLGGMPKVSQPIPIGDSQLLISSGYGLGSRLLQLSTGEGGAWNLEEVWKKRELNTKFSNIVIRDGFAYAIDDDPREGTGLVCVEVENGTRRWRGMKTGHGQILLADDKIVVLTESGEVVLVDAGPDAFNERGRFQALTGKTWNNPTLAGPYLLVRNAEEAGCYELPVIR